MTDDLLLAQDILEAIYRIEEYTAEGEDQFFEDRRTRNLEVIGEATKNVSTGFRAAHPEVPWREMAGMRDKLIHDYPGVDLVVVWGVVEQEVPAVRARLEDIVERAD